MSIIAIDAHTHINHGSPYDTKVNEVYTADLEQLIKLNDGAGIGKMLCSTFASVLSDQDIEAENEYMYQLSKEVERLYQWVVIDPRNDNTFLQADRMLKSEKCVGIKLHPPYHGYSLLEYGDKMFSYASEKEAIVQIHPETNPVYLLPLADKYPKVTFLVAHLGTAGFVDAIEQARNRNIYTDTSGSASTNNLVVEYAVRRVGSEHILFGTDTYSPGFQRGRIEYALISDKDKENILKNNAERLFGF